MTRIKLNYSKVTNVSDVLYVADLAEKMGMTESAVRMAVARDKERVERKRALPKPFKVGAKLAWRRVDLDVWLARKAGDA
jgi:predicted DNA-binding transcriptional regulator AlpA